ncbi:MerR family transcriptional regulator [Actinomadura atramentaria]|uniref:MerR family transcriptional regulator n=1 Tax=Actinomadura atramentaria TaxID=1990 RepID=UPI00035FDE5A|nr:MerR family transcriptional regulator [Actinomadura atramentaria]
MTEYYPGSRTPINRNGRHLRPATSNAVPEIPDHIRPQPWRCQGEVIDLYTVGQLADILGRKAVTLRKWEAEGVIPPTRLRSPSQDPRARKRLYTREQVQGILKIAHEEGILNSSRRPLGQTRFKTRVAELFTGLEEAARARAARTDTHQEAA